MKGRPTNRAEREFHNQLCRYVGCIACAIDGHFNDYSSVHHVDGRTKPWAHWFVLPLCGGHHQDGTGMPGLIAIHPWKAQFEARYGTQEELLIKSLDWLYDGWGIVVPEARRAANHQFFRMVA
jgi:hypothetical protein